MRIDILKYGDDKMEDVFSLRKKIFTVEQGISSSLDNDGLDKDAFHILVYKDLEPIGVGRLVMNKTTATLSRIAVIKKYRGKGIAKDIIRKLEKIAESQTAKIIDLYPHKRLNDFYKSLGYLLDKDYKGIVCGHELIRMYKKKAAPI